MSVAKVTPLLGLSWEPLLLPPREFLLMIPKETNIALRHRVNFPKEKRIGRRVLPFLTLDWQHVQPLQAVSAGRWEAVPLGQAALSTAQHSSRRDDAGGGNLPHPLVQLLDLPLLGGLQGLHLCQVSDEGQKVTFR